MTTPCFLPPPPSIFINLLVTRKELKDICVKENEFHTQMALLRLFLKRVVEAKAREEQIPPMSVTPGRRLHCLVKATIVCIWNIPQRPVVKTWPSLLHYLEVEEPLEVT